PRRRGGARAHDDDARRADALRTRPSQVAEPPPAATDAAVPNTAARDRSWGLSPRHGCAGQVLGTVPETWLRGASPGDCPQDMVGGDTARWDAFDASAAPDAASRGPTGAGCAGQSRSSARQASVCSPSRGAAPRGDTPPNPRSASSTVATGPTLTSS